MHELDALKYRCNELFRHGGYSQTSFASFSIVFLMVLYKWHSESLVFSRCVSSRRQFTHVFLTENMHGRFTQFLRANSTCFFEWISLSFIEDLRCRRQKHEGFSTCALILAQKHEGFSISSHANKRLDLILLIKMKQIASGSAGLIQKPHCIDQFCSLFDAFRAPGANKT